MKRNLLKIAALGSAVSAYLLPRLVLAQNDVNNGLRGIGSLFPRSNFNSVPQFLAFVVQILLFLSGGVAVLFVIIGGFQYILSAGNQETATKGKKTVVNAIIGIVLIVLSYLIINVIVNTLLA